MKAALLVALASGALVIGAAEWRELCDIASCTWGGPYAEPASETLVAARSTAPIAAWRAAAPVLAGAAERASATPSPAELPEPARAALIASLVARANL